MKIDSKLQFPNEGQPERVSGQRSHPAQSKDSAASGVKPASGEDTVSLSGVHGDVQRLTAAVSQVPDVRAEKIAALQGKVRGGNFKPDSGQIAEAIVSEQSQRKFKA